MNEDHAARIEWALSRPGCPICAAPIGSWTLFAQMSHVRGHSWLERIGLRWRTGTPLPDLLINRKYGTEYERRQAALTPEQRELQDLIKGHFKRMADELREGFEGMRDG